MQVCSWRKPALFNYRNTFSAVSRSHKVPFARQCYAIYVVPIRPVGKLYAISRTPIPESMRKKATGCLCLPSICPSAGPTRSARHLTGNMASFLALTDPRCEGGIKSSVGRSISASIFVHCDLRATALPPRRALVPISHRFTSITKSFPTEARSIVSAEAFRLPRLNHAEVPSTLVPSVVCATCWWTVIVGAVSVVGIAVVGNEGGAMVVVHKIRV